jgi:SAM-dependent methyltransferase
MARHNNPPSLDRFAWAAEAVGWRYRTAGRFAQGFVRGKLRHDPVYRELLNIGVPPEEGAVLDLGCGRGIAVTLLATAFPFDVSSCATDLTPPRWVGMERRPFHAAVARAALGEEAEISTQDVLAATLPRSRLILLIDVLHYLGRDEQDRLLERAAAALTDGGLLVMRETDADGGWRYWMTAAAERLSAWLRGEWHQAYHYRGQSDWSTRLRGLGLGVETRPMSAGTPFANVLFVARRAAGSVTTVPRASQTRASCPSVSDLG